MSKSTKDPEVSNVSGDQPVVIKPLGRQTYQSVWQKMRVFTDERGQDSSDEIWVLEHEAVFTLGQAGKHEHILQAGDIPIVQTDRGGQVTYHGPGQLVVYPLLMLKRLGLGVRDLVSCLEGSVVDVLADLGIEAKPDKDAPGVYVRGRKIASLGLRVRRGCSFHGVSINVDMELEPFSRINPCGYAGMEVTQLRGELSGDCPSVDRFAELYIPKLLARLGLRAA